MPPLENGLRGELEAVVKKARVIAERGARSAIESLTVHEARSGAHLDKSGQQLRARLRAHAKQLGDGRNAQGAQEITRLVRECAYEHWHRMLFARFLAENELLIHPEHNVSVSLDDVEELAREAGLDKWELASRFAQGMLPQIFRVDDPVLAVALPRERTLELEQLLESLPPATFRADDSLGWVYQFWQAEEKDRVNASGEKITGETLPAVTQLFTEHYMVLFLLHNTIGAWHAGKALAARPELAANATSEQKLSAAVRLNSQGGYDFEYLRFVREQQEGDENGEPTGPWRPAAGTFDGWPRETKDLKVLDPCCGSGHFLVAAFDLLVRLRMTEDGLSLDDAIRSVLAENLFGLEIDGRCCQIAAFNLALTAWRMAGKAIELPALNVACSGIGPHATADEWIVLAEQSGVPMPTLGRQAIKEGLLNLHRLFSQAPILGSLIDPTELPTDLIAADYETIKPYLAAILKAEKADDETRERAIAASGMVRAADLLAGDYTLVITNVPFLGSGNQASLLKSHIKRMTGQARADLAIAFMQRCLAFCVNGGCTSTVLPQGWLYSASQEPVRRLLLRAGRWHFLVRLGTGAFDTISGAVVNVALFAVDTTTLLGGRFFGIDVSDVAPAQSKAKAAKVAQISLVSQEAQINRRDQRISFDDAEAPELLDDYARAYQGMTTGDLPQFGRVFWELPQLTDNWRFFQSTVVDRQYFGGRSQAIHWEDGNGRMKEVSQDPFRGSLAWDRPGVAVSQMGDLPVTIYGGDAYDNSVSIISPKKTEHLPAIWAFCYSELYCDAIRKVDRSLKVSNASLTKVIFDLSYWQRIAAEEYPDGLPEPESDDPTQWLFHGRPDEAQEGTVLQVAVARLLGYRWPAELDEKMRLSKRARALVERCGEVAQFADDDGVVCIPPVRGERSAADRLAALLAACGVKADRDLNAWLRDEFFQEHCGLFHHRPFIWHIWDGRKDGFSALVNYHKLAAPGGAGRRLQTALTHAYLGDWIKDQKDQVNDGKPGAEARLAAALDLKAELESILAGEPPYDIFVRWKPLREQPIGWEPDINDGVRLNIRPFLLAKDVGRKGAGILRFKPNIKWDKDRGKEPNRSKTDYPWFWNCDPEQHAAHRTDFAGGGDFDGNRWNDLHYTNAFKQAARNA
ncbi:MAG: N-6 DNA methylase [Phycisphaerae bacterium]|nr:N-6 DNA methylase [Phycisphaerae bacterium]